MLLDRCPVLSVCMACISCLSVTLVYCGQTVGWIKMKLGTQVGLGPGHIVLDGDPSPLPQRGTAPQFSAHICYDQKAEWIKMPLGTEVHLNPSNIVLDGDPAPLPKNGAEPPIFGPCLLWPNGWMDQNATWHGGSPVVPGHIVLDLDAKKGGTAPRPQFSTHVYCGQTAGWIKMPVGREVGLDPSNIVLDGTQLPLPKEGAKPLRPMSIVAKQLDG